MHGKVLEILAQPGDRVIAGQRLAVIEAMKMEHTLRAPFDGAVVKVRSELPAHKLWKAPKSWCSNRTRRQYNKSMPLHLIKLCVGADSVQDLEDWIKQKLKEKRKRREKPEHIHRTRMVPKRAEELIDGGSLYWVIRGEIMCRQRIRDDPALRRQGRHRPLRHRARAQSRFWSSRGPIAPSRAGAISPSRTRRADLDKRDRGAAAMPETLRRELRELGLADVIGLRIPELPHGVTPQAIT